MKIEKTEVTNGVYWIEVPHKDIRILCGSPSDSVKHMMSKGLIRTKEDQGVMFETGPNMILLSDHMVQNSKFSNLAEFPVLQMLYKQGMILPNHPGNTGIKPTLIGSREQVNIQLEYIFRGNYGLKNIDELLKAGADQKLAEELMEIKLKFAFGSLKQSNELLNSIYVEKEKIEIIEGLFIERLDINIFEISYGEEKIEVDLNISSHKNYEPTYYLGSQSFNREYFSIIHSGEGDGWDTKRPCMGTIITFQGKLYLIDAGPHINATLNALGISVNEIEGIFHTHSHDDHFSGLPSLIQSDHKIKYYSSSIVRESVVKKLSILLSIESEKLSNFFEFIDLEIDEWNNINGLEVKPILSAHPVETNIFYFRTLSADGYKSYGHLADICSFQVLDNLFTKEPTNSIIKKQKSSYLETTDIKKIDNGGGMIHGTGADFFKDSTKKLILSHSSLPIDESLKEIGSGAPFGSIDNLIPAQKDYANVRAVKFLMNYFSDINEYWLEILTNNTIAWYNPESIIMKKGVQSKYVYLVVYGNVDMINREKGINNILSSGAIIGDIYSIDNIESKHAYRASSYVKLLEIPSKVYKQFVKSNNLYEEIKSIQENRAILEQTILFGESISYIQLSNIAKSMNEITLSASNAYAYSDSLVLIKSGELTLDSNGKEIFKLTKGDFFGENSLLYGSKLSYDVSIKSDTIIYEIDNNTLKEIPIIYWKLYTTDENRTKEFISKTITDSSLFTWSKEYELNIEEVDAQHIKLFNLTNKVLIYITEIYSTSELVVLLNEYYELLDMHCKYEEELFAKYGYIDSDNHQNIHQKLLDNVKIYLKKVETLSFHEKLELVDFLTNWLKDHILIEDMKYAKWINNQN